MRRQFLAAALIGVTLIALSACSSSPASRFYVLSSDMKDAPSKTGDRCKTIGVGPVELPGYLDRPQIVTLASDNEVILAEFDRWAQPLADNFNNALAANISRLVCTRTVYQFPWHSSDQPDYRIKVKVIHMEGILGGKASLEAWWAVTEGKDKKVIAERRSHYSEPVQGQDYQALVQAYSKILSALSKDIVKAVPNL